jgi:hypothetical protein
VSVSFQLFLEGGGIVAHEQRHVKIIIVLESFRVLI